MPDLRYDYNSIRREIARELGFDTDTTKWTTKENQDVEDTLDYGLRLYYNPPLLNGERSHHRWSFMQPVGTITTVAGAEDYTLPTNFEGITGEIVLSNAGSFAKLRQLGEGNIRSYRAQVPDSATPSCIAVASYRDNTSEPTKWRAMLWPKPDAIYTINFRYLAGQQRLTSINLFALGPASMDDFLRAAVMAACEMRMDDEKGKHWQTYLERAREAVMSDRRNRQDTFLGQNGEWIEGIRSSIGGPDAFFFGGWAGNDSWQLTATPISFPLVSPPDVGYCDQYGVPYSDENGDQYASLTT